MYLKTIRILKAEPGKVAQKLGILLSLPEDLSLVLGLTPYSGLSVKWTYIHIPTYTFKKKKKNLKILK